MVSSTSNPAAQLDLASGGSFNQMTNRKQGKLK
jgi:hypothetical protein